MIDDTIAQRNQRSRESGAQQRVSKRRHGFRRTGLGGQRRHRLVLVVGLVDVAATVRVVVVRLAVGVFGDWPVSPGLGRFEVVGVGAAVLEVAGVGAIDPGSRVRGGRRV